MALRAYQLAIEAVTSASGSGGGYSRVVTMGEASVGAITIVPTVSSDSAQEVAKTARKPAYASEDKTVEKEAGGSNTYNFTQNNYSPKALDSTTIYRQTSNQFSRFEKVVS